MEAGEGNRALSSLQNPSASLVSWVSMKFLPRSPRQERISAVVAQIQLEGENHDVPLALLLHAGRSPKSRCERDGTRETGNLAISHAPAEQR